ncbi:unnamed protein product [Paramecium pentaurelia]|uniref:Uncharacterized protein n=1 Tax=Paramecium pentaurelia TaxID=43138 RepID=A0A8S1TR87_9CILI|nr:unnamed protein product [Paramecium pentaurelia]
MSSLCLAQKEKIWKSNWISRFRFELNFYFIQVEKISSENQNLQNKIKLDKLQFFNIPECNQIQLIIKYGYMTQDGDLSQVTYRQLTEITPPLVNREQQQREIKRVVTLARLPLHSPQFVVNEDLLQQLCLLQQTFLISLANLNSLYRQRKNSKMIEEIPQGNIVSGRKAHITSQASDLNPDPPNGKKRRGKRFRFHFKQILLFFYYLSKKKTKLSTQQQYVKQQLNLDFIKAIINVFQVIFNNLFHGIHQIKAVEK